MYNIKKVFSCYYKPFNLSLILQVAAAIVIIGYQCFIPTSYHHHYPQILIIIINTSSQSSSHGFTLHCALQYSVMHCTGAALLRPPLFSSLYFQHIQQYLVFHYHSYITRTINSSSCLYITNIYVVFTQLYSTIMK